MSATAPQSGRAELAKTRQASRHLFLFVALFSMAVNVYAHRAFVYAAGL